MSGFRYAYNQFVYYGEEVRTSIDRVARFGYDGIELADEPDAFDEATTSNGSPILPPASVRGR